MLGVGVSFSVTSANFSFIYTLFWSHPEDLILHIVSLKKHNWPWIPKNTSR